MGRQRHKSKKSKAKKSKILVKPATVVIKNNEKEASNNIVGISALDFNHRRSRSGHKASGRQQWYNLSIIDNKIIINVMHIQFFKPNLVKRRSRSLKNFGAGR